MAAPQPGLITDEEIDNLLDAALGGGNPPQSRQIENDGPQAPPSAPVERGDRVRLDIGEDGTQEDVGAVRAIWGSSIQVSEAMKLVFDFVRKFKKEPVVPGAEAYYVRIIRQMYEREIRYLNLDMQNVRAYNEDLFEMVVAYPQETIPLFDAVFQEIYKEMFQTDENAEEMDGLAIETRPFNLESTPMRDLDPEDLDTLVTVRGMMIRSGGVLPDMHVGFFECSECKETVANRVAEGRILEPSKCPRCNMRDCMKMIHNRCVYIDKQVVKLQEAPETVPEGSTPQTVQLSAHDALVDYCKPGDKLLVTGIFRASQVRQTTAHSNVRQLFKTYLDVVHFKRTERGTLSGASAQAAQSNQVSENLAAVLNSVVSGSNAMSDLEPFTQAEADPSNDTNGEEDAFKDHNKDDEEMDVEEKAREEEFRRLAARPDIYELLVRSLAPSVWEMEDVKRGILCQLFGGSTKVFNEKSTGKFRSEVNILLCGDPGTSKSQLLQYVHKLAPRGIYTSGKGSSAVGLTAYITKDQDTGESVLESGALTLSDRGICCIDEFDKMSDATRSILHEAMEQQTVSVAKAGIIATLNARTSILASANPRESRYNTKLSVVENIQLPPTLLSRFDLIYLVLDKPRPDSDAKLARHIIGMYSKERMRPSASSGSAASLSASTSRMGTSNASLVVGRSLLSDATSSRATSTSTGPILATETLRRYIAFAKRVCTPVLSDEAGAALVKGYVAMRKGGASQNIITATTRQLESLIRLSEALSKMRLSPIVTEVEVAEAIRLMQVATYTAAIDPTTGRLDMGLINTGRGAAHELHIRNLVQQITDVMHKNQADSIHEDQLYGTIVALSSDPVIQPDFIEALHTLQEDNVISITGVGRTRIVRRM
jgi:DNA replication licensing factor MCM4